MVSGTLAGEKPVHFNATRFTFPLLQVSTIQKGERYALTSLYAPRHTKITAVGTGLRQIHSQQCELSLGPASQVEEEVACWRRGHP